jgi:hypothetical protein
MVYRLNRCIWIIALVFCYSVPTSAQIDTWQLGGSGLPWAGQDTVDVMIDFADGVIKPIYLTPDVNIISLLKNWSVFRQPNLQGAPGFLDGESPRVWKWDDGRANPTESGILLVDQDSTTYSTAIADLIEKQFLTLDLAVPMPARQFGFFTPPKGIRADGSLLVDDYVPAFQVSLQGETSELINVPAGGTVQALENIIYETRENFTPRVLIDFPQQYVRFIRYAPKLTELDEEAQATSGNNLAIALRGTIADFELFGEGVPKRSLYKTRLINLGLEQNFGRLFFKATPIRMINGVPTETAEVNAQVRIEVRTGRDDDPDVFHEYIVTGQEKVVSRERYYDDLRPRWVKRCTTCEYVVRAARPGIRASVAYDDENWTFWSTPFTESGQSIQLRSGAFIQLKVTFESSAFTDYVRLDSLWIEQAPLLAREVFGEVARLDQLQPIKGYAEVELGEMTDFAYELAAVFSGSGQLGFDELRIRTGGRTSFKSLALGGVEVDPREVVEDDNGLRLLLPERMTRDNNQPMRLVFGAEVFDLATSFDGEVVDREQETLPQPIIAGDVSEEISTNGLRVLSSGAKAPELVQDLHFSTPVMTPNGDGVHDELAVTYSLFGLPEQVSVVLSVYSLDGRQVAAVEAGTQRSGTQTVTWNGRDENGRLLAPGVYLLAVGVQSEQSEDLKVSPLGIAY